MKLNQNKKSKM